MEYLAMWPKGLHKGPYLSIGVYITYREGEYDDLVHLLHFLYDHFGFTKKDFTKRGLAKKEKPDFPLVYVNGEPYPFRCLIDEIGQLEYDWISIGFRDEHQKLFRAYQKHLDADVSPGTESLKKFFSEAEGFAFGNKTKMH